MRVLFKRSKSRHEFLRRPAVNGVAHVWPAQSNRRNMATLAQRNCHDVLQLTPLAQFRARTLNDGGAICASGQRAKRPSPIPAKTGGAKRISYNCRTMANEQRPLQYQCQALDQATRLPFQFVHSITVGELALQRAHAGIE